MQVHNHRELEINLIRRGQGAYLINGGRYPIRTGTLLWLFPAQPHVLLEASDDFSMYVVVFRPRLIRSLARGPQWGILLQQDPGQVFAQALPPTEFQFMDRLCRELERLPNSHDAFFNRGLGFLLAYSWEKGALADSMAAEEEFHPSVERVIHQLRAGPLDEPLSSLAKQAGLSYSRLAGLFRKQMGLTLGEFRNQLRVEQFVALMREYPQRTLLDLALEAGFGSYAQCHRVVRRHAGRKPAELRRTARESRES